MAANTLDIGVGSTKTPSRKDIADARGSVIDIDMGDTSQTAPPPPPVIEPEVPIADQSFDSGRTGIKGPPTGVLLSEPAKAPPTLLKTAPKIDIVEENVPVPITPPKPRTMLTTAPKIDVVEDKVAIDDPDRAFFLDNESTGEKEFFSTREDLNKRQDVITKDAEARTAKLAEADIKKAENDDFMASTASFISDLADPNTPDAIKTAQMNELITQFGPENQAATDSMLLQLKQQGLEGTGAGNAMMLLMARGNNAQFSNMTQRLNTESAQRIFNMNKFGADFGLRRSADLRAEETKTFNENSALMSVAAEAGDWQSFKLKAEEMGLPNIDTDKLEQMDDFERAEFIARTIKNQGFAVEAADTFSSITGLPLDTSALATLDPATQAVVDARLKAIELIPDAAARQTAMIKLAEEYPEALGFPGDPEGAKNMVLSIDFSKTGENGSAFEDASAKLRGLAGQDNPDPTQVILDGKALWSALPEVQLDSLYTGKSGSFSDWDLEAQNESGILDAMSQFGVETMDDIDTREEKEAFLSLMKFNEFKSNPVNLADEMFNTFASNFASNPEMSTWFDGSDLTKESVAKSWISENLTIPGNFVTDEQGNLVPSRDFLPPWNENFSQYSFLTWPRKYDSEGNELPPESQYSGEEFRSDLNSGDAYNEVATEDEDRRLENAYKKYKQREPTGMSWLQWYDESKGGTQKIGDESTESGIVKNTGGGQQFANLETFTDLVRGDNAAITNDDIVFSLTQETGNTSIPSSRAAAEDWLSANASGGGSNPNGWLNFEGLGMQLQSGGVSSSKRNDLAVYKLSEDNGGGTFVLGENGKWYAGDIASSVNSANVDEYGSYRTNSFASVELPKSPSQMTPDELVQWSEYSKYIDTIVARGDKSAGTTIVGVGVDIPSFAQLQAAIPFDSWIAQGQPEFDISKDTAKDIRAGRNVFLGATEF